MSKPCFAVLALVIGFSSSAIAQNLSAAHRAACQPDFDKYCKGTVPGDGRIFGCLDKQRDQLAEACRKVLDGLKQ